MTKFLRLFCLTVLLVGCFASNAKTRSQLSKRNRNDLYSESEQRKSEISQKRVVSVGLDFARKALSQQLLDICLAAHPGGPTSLSDYHLENWPEMVNQQSRYWSWEDIEFIRKALPSLVCHWCKTTTEHVKDRRKRLLKQLVQIYNNQTLSDGNRVMWSKVHVYGWPNDVRHDRVDKFTAEEVKAVYRALPFLFFIPIGRGEERIVTAEAPSESLLSRIQITSAVPEEPKSLDKNEFADDKEDEKDRVHIEMSPLIEETEVSFVETESEDDASFIRLLANVSPVDDSYSTFWEMFLRDNSDGDEEEHSTGDEKDLEGHLDLSYFDLDIEK